MNLFAFTDLSLLDGCKGGSSLLSEQCDWTCKHRRPFARCSLHFSHTLMHKTNQAWKGCWVSEKCDVDTVSGLNITCEPEEAHVMIVAPTVLISGTISLIAVDVDSFVSSKAEVAPALQGALASVLPEIQPESISIKNISSGERQLQQIGQMTNWKYEQRSVLVGYIISASYRAASVVDASLSSVQPEILGAAINAHLIAAGFGFHRPVVVDRLSNTTLAVSDSVELQNAAEYFTALISMHSTVRQHLSESMEQLTTTQSSLQAGNGSDALSSVSREVQEQLATVIAAHSHLEKQLANLTATYHRRQSELAQAQAVDLVTGQRVNTLRAQLNSLTEQLHLMNASRSSSANALSKLQDKYAALELQFKGQLKEHNLTKQALQNAAQKMLHTQEELGTRQASYEALEEQLQISTKQIGRMRMELWHANSEHNASRKEIVRLRLNLTAEIFKHAITRASLIQSQSEHASVLEQLEQERTAHKKTQLATAWKPSQIVLGITAAVLVLLVGLLIIVIAKLMSQRRYASTPVVPFDSNQGAGDTVVVGRPVHDPQQADSEASFCKVSCKQPSKPTFRPATETWNEDELG